MDPHWLRTAAEHGLPLAQFNLGLMHLKGEGVERDLAVAAHWFRMAAERGDARAQFCLGEMYFKGEGVERDLAVAAHWFRMAAEQGNERAQSKLGEMHFKGLGVEGNPAMAVLSGEGLMAPRASAGVAADSQEVREAVARDKSRAVDVILVAREARERPIHFPVVDTYGGHAWGPAWYFRDRAEVRTELGFLQADPFFARVDVTFDDEVKPIAMLLSKARAAGEIYKEDEWEIISYTSPLYAKILDQEVGTRYTLGVGHTGGEIGTSGRFERLVPQVCRADYRLQSGRAFVESEAVLERSDFVASAQRTAKAYAAAESFGLGEIIELADKSQRSAMHLPFLESVLIEGPPGSGKTSVGIMRVPCLIDRQWAEMGLTLGKDRPFHTASSMRVLVLNEKLVDYLVELIRSLRIDGVVVEAMNELMQRVCGEAGTLKGKPGNDPPILAKLKAMPYTPTSYWAGFKEACAAYRLRYGAQLQRRMEGSGGVGQALWKELEAWFNEVAASSAQNGTLSVAVHLASRAARWHAEVQRRVPDAESLSSRNRWDRSALEAAARVNAERASQLKALASLQAILDDVVRSVVDHWAVVRAMFTTAEYAEVLEQFAKDTTPEFAREADREWREQLRPIRPLRTEYDALLASWLGVHVTLMRHGEGEPFVGGTLDRYTHLMVDEAQDISTTHSIILHRLISRGGTLTFVGDLRQRLSPVGGLRSWDDLRVGDLVHAAFVINYRQTFELGQFVAGLHERLFEEAPVWHPSEERRGPLPKVSVEQDQRLVPRIAAAEVRRWRSAIPGATVGVLYDGRWTKEQLQGFVESLERELMSARLSVVSVDQETPGSVFRKTNCVFVASVVATKGLEFDAVVFVDPFGACKLGRPDQTTRSRHGLYVATSRAKQGLSIVVTNRIDTFVEMASAGLCVLSESSA